MRIAHTLRVRTLRSSPGGGYLYGAWSTRFSSSSFVLVTMLLAWPAAATASTTVSGDRDTNAPLVVDPSSNPSDAFSANIDAATRIVGFIQKMPVTKRISQVTLGDLGKGDGCTTTPALRLFLYEHPTGDIDTATQVLYSSQYVPVPDNPGKVTWTIPATTLAAGKGYSFRITSNGLYCGSIKQTTWEHSASTVSPGPASCAYGPLTYPARNGSLKRMWHVIGSNDRVSSCASYTQAWAFDPSMPSGWLVTNGDYVMSAINWTSQPPGSSCGSYAGQMGAQVVFWRQSPGKPANYSDYVCMWTQYADVNQPFPPHGWYYGDPWRSDHGNGAPRDVYLRLDTIDYGGLLAQYSPVLAYDSEENFRVLSPGAETDFYQEGGNADDSNQLKDNMGAFATASPLWASELGIGQLSLQSLASVYTTDAGRRTGTAPKGEGSADGPDFLSERGNGQGPFGIGFSSEGYANDAATMEARPGYANKVYGRVVYGGDGKLWLQYWFFYYFDSQGDLGGGVHEGDWEMVQVGLDSNDSPDVAVYAQHASGERCGWASVSTIGSRPLVYVARASHASYFRGGSYADPSPDDRADGNGASATPGVQEIKGDSPGWVGWPGRWGDSGSNSPPGPQFNNPLSKWNDPSAWRDHPSVAACGTVH